MRTFTHSWAAALLAAFTGGCSASSLLHVQAGGVIGTSGALGGALEGSAGRGLAPVGLEVTARAKFTDRVLSGAIGSGLYLVGTGYEGRPFGFAHGGMHLLQVDVIDATPFVSAFSPYLNFGLGLCVDGCGSALSHDRYNVTTTDSLDVGVITVGLSAEYAVRFLRDGEGFFGLSVGFARFSRATTRANF